jgi:hypothetical protein
MQHSATHDFTMDPNLLVSVIKAQAGTLSKAVLEGVMNSIDAGATRVDITVDCESFRIEDNGRGFTSDDEIKNWFGRFGTPHVEGDAIYGKFRMGRGQMMSFAVTHWRSGPFQMVVDIENRGLTYDLQTLDEPVKGCRIDGKLYQPMSSWKLADTLTELKKFVAYTPRPVYVNGELFGAPAARLKTWTFEDEYAYYKVVHDATEMEVYNQGVFVESAGTWRIGMGGVIVSKLPLKVNFARNSVLEDSCPVWRQIVAKLECVVLAKLTQAKKLNEGERKFLARRLPALRRLSSLDWRQAKVLTDPSGKHLAVDALRRFSRFVHVPESGALACAAHDEADGTFVVTDALLTRFGSNSLEEWLAAMQGLGEGILQPGYTVIDQDAIAKLGLGGAKLLEASGLSRRDQAAFATLTLLNTRLAARLVAAGVVSQERQLLIGKHRTNKFVAWTDGKTYITANKKFFSLFEVGLDGVLEWLQTLVHEYTHDTDDSESHSHGEVFYRKFHDTVFSAGCLSMATLTHAGLEEYLHQLSLHGLPKPHRLTRQLGRDGGFGAQALNADTSAQPTLD